MFPRHMLWHIVLMNCAAPLFAWWYASRGTAHFRAEALARWLGTTQALVLTGVMQLALLLTWHAPGALSLAMSSAVAGIAMQVTLFAAALAFWGAVFLQSTVNLWRALVAILVTGKIYCLMAAILVFSPRVLYPESMFRGGMAISLDGQHLAGLMMVVACPVSYITIALVLTSRWFNALGTETAASQAGEG